TINLPGISVSEFFDSSIRLGGIGLNVRTGQSSDIFVLRILRHLGSGAGENDLLLEWKVFVLPELFVLAPDSFHIQNPHLPLSSRREVRNLLGGIYVNPTDKDAVNRLERFRIAAPLGSAPDSITCRMIL